MGPHGWGSDDGTSAPRTGADERAGAPPSPVDDHALAVLTELSDDVTVVVSPGGRVRYASGAAERVWGYVPEDEVGRSFLDHVHPDDLEIAVARFGLVDEDLGETIQVTLRVIRSDGAVRHAVVHATNLVDHPSVRGVALNIRDITARVELRDGLRWRAHHDDLTGLLNRRAFLERVQAALDADVPGPGRPAVLYLDLDGFKAVNDTLGHLAGDRVLATIGSRLRAAVRGSDCAARLGGDEFAVLVEHHGSLDAVRSLATRLAGTLEDPIRRDDGLPIPPVTTSIGVAIAADGDDPESLLLTADRALYRAKGRGPGRIVVAGDPHTDDR